MSTAALTTAESRHLVAVWNPSCASNAMEEHLRILLTHAQREDISQGGVRPALVFSVDRFNHGPAGLVIVIPIASRDRGIPTHVRIPNGEAGLDAESFAKCEDIRSISKDRLVRYRGTVTSPPIQAVEYIVRVLLGL